MCSLCPHECWLSLSQPSFAVQINHLIHVSYFCLCKAHLSLRTWVWLLSSPKAKMRLEEGVAAPPAHWQLQQVTVLGLSSAMITWDRRTFESQKEFSLQFPFPKKLCWGLESQKLKISWWYLIVLSFFFQMLSSTSFQWPFPSFFFFFCHLSLSKEEGREAWSEGEQE